MTGSAPSSPVPVGRAAPSLVTPVNSPLDKVVILHSSSKPGVFGSISDSLWLFLGSGSLENLGYLFVFRKFGEVGVVLG